MSERVTEYLNKVVDRDIEYNRYEDDGKTIHQFWYLEDGVKYGQEYYRDDGRFIEPSQIISEIDSFPEVPPTTEFPREKQND